MRPIVIAMSRPNLEILACEETKLGLICLRRRELLSRPGTVVTEITLNQEFLMSSYITESERALARIALQDHHGDELNVLIGGLGLGYTAQEVLESARVVRVDVVELLPQVVGWLDRGLVRLAAELRADSRLFVAEGDVYACLSLPPRRLSDLILIDVDQD